MEGRGIQRLKHRISTNTNKDEDSSSKNHTQNIQLYFISFISSTLTFKINIQLRKEEKATVTWYATQREREVNSPTLRCLNQQVPRTDRIKVRMKAKANCTPWPIIGWIGKEMQVILVAWPEEIEEEERAKWLARPFSAKMIPFRHRKFGKGTFVWEQRSACKDMLTYSQNSGRSPRPQEDSLVLDRHWRKRDAKSANSEDVTRP